MTTFAAPAHPTFRKITYRTIGKGTIVVAKKKRSKPSHPRRITDPAEAARIEAETRRTPARWGANDSALRLDANADVRVEEETRTRTRRISRYDCFGILNSRGALADDQDTSLARLAAVRRLEEKLAERMRLEGLAAVIGGGKSIPVSDKSLAAAQCLEDIERRTGLLSYGLIVALVEPSVKDGQPVNNWRAVVERKTGEYRHTAQANLVRAASQNLLDAWQAYDKEGPMRRAA